jgi:hypothetical protein
VFFMPSLLFWPSGVGKEALMIFGLGLAAYGTTRLFTTGLRGGIPLVLGLAACAVIRPHMAAMVAVAVVAGYVVRPSPPEHRETAIVAKGLVLAGLAVGTFYLVGLTNDFLARAGVQGEGGVTDTLQNTMFRTQQGGSAFSASVLEDPKDAPVAAITVMFRPLIYEGRNFQGYLAGVEGTLLLAWTVWRWRWVFEALRSVRRRPYVATAAAFVAVFIFGFSSIANFGILARQRAQVLPFFLVLLSVPVADWWHRHPRIAEEERRADAQPVA